MYFYSAVPASPTTRSIDLQVTRWKDNLIQHVMIGFPVISAQTSLHIFILCTPSIKLKHLNLFGPAFGASASLLPVAKRLQSKGRSPEKIAFEPGNHKPPR